MKIKGYIIQNTRKQKKLSQVALADGICTQGTISNIETKHVCDSIEILDALCKRLNIELDTILDDDDEKKMLDLLDHAEELCNIFKHKEALHVLKNAPVDRESIKNIELKTRWLYLTGITYLLGDEDIPGSIFYFSQINELSNHRSIYSVLAMNGLGIAYEMTKSVDRALVYHQKSVTMLEEFKAEYHLPVEATKVYYNTAKFHAQIKDYATAYALAKKGMDLNKLYQSTYMLDLLSYEVAFNQFMLSPDQIEPDFTTAKVFAQFNDNQSLLQVIAQDTQLLRRNLLSHDKAEGSC